MPKPKTPAPQNFCRARTIKFDEATDALLEAESQREERAISWIVRRAVMDRYRHKLNKAS